MVPVAIVCLAFFVLALVAPTSIDVFRIALGILGATGFLLAMLAIVATTDSRRKDRAPIEQGESAPVGGTGRKRLPVDHS